ncbi:hypothetical protein [Sorangium cellulosum]|uniref:hypothetical protein n=1 Tax=Sorangium cellulosum TaxID=56 RepID=UPI0012FFB045|nr:hypothetical protein [Sorangium cellulosum]
MSPLAQAIHAVLRKLVPHQRADISYTDLVAKLPQPYNTLPADSPILSAALGELVTGCRNHSPALPAISALVVHHFPPRVPGPGYYTQAHPAAVDDAHAMLEWYQEITAARRTTYPMIL